MKPKTEAIEKAKSRKPTATESMTENERTILHLKRTRLYKAIRKDLLDGLDRSGTVGRYYNDLVEDYMDLWIAKSLAVEDVRRRGIVVTYENGGGQTGRKKNDSVELQIKLNAQMLKLLSEMGIKPSQGDGGGDDL